MAKVMRVGLDLPAKTLDLFELVCGELRWAGERPDGCRKRAPWGCKAGGNAVFGRGKLVSVSGMNLLTCDIEYALRNAGEWPWQHGSDVPLDVLALAGGETCRALALSRWKLAGDAVVWRETRGDNALEGEKARGLAMSGFRCPVITTNKLGFLCDDVKHLLTTSRWPWELEWD